MQTYWCPNCQMKHTIGKQVAAKLGFALAGGALGSAAKDPWVALLTTLGGLFVGHLIDEAVLPKCPDCKSLLQAIDEYFL